MSNQRYMARLTQLYLQVYHIAMVVVMALGLFSKVKMISKTSTMGKGSTEFALMIFEYATLGSSSSYPFPELTLQICQVLGMSRLRHNGTGIIICHNFLQFSVIIFTFSEYSIVHVTKYLLCTPFQSTCIRIHELHLVCLYPHQ